MSEEAGIAAVFSAQKIRKERLSHGIRQKKSFDFFLNSA
jgi:hypothetical protein